MRIMLPRREGDRIANAVLRARSAYAALRPLKGVAAVYRAMLEHERAFRAMEPRGKFRRLYPYAASSEDCAKADTASWLAHYATNASALDSCRTDPQNVARHRLAAEVVLRHSPRTIIAALRSARMRAGAVANWTIRDLYGPRMPG